MEVTLKINKETTEKAKTAIEYWIGDSMIDVTWEPEAGILNLNNSTGNIVELNTVKNTIAFKGRRHALISGTSNACSSVFIESGLLNFSGEITKVGRGCKVMEYKSHRRDVPWWEWGLDHPAVVAEKERWKKAGVWPEKPTDQEYQIGFWNNKVCWLNDGNSVPIKFSGLDYRRAGAMGVNLSATQA